MTHRGKHARRHLELHGQGGEWAWRALRVVSSLLIASGLGLLLYVNASDWLSTRTAEGQISELSSQVAKTDDGQAKAILKQARAYNEWLSGAKRTDAKPYAAQLSLGDGSPMAYIEIPKIAVKLPVFHGTEEAELMNGVGHLEGTSLPVGGKNSHCVLLAHSGMRNARMFDELYKVEEGDVFMLWTMNEAAAYEVYEKETAKPDLASKRIGIEEGRDLVTLITCTPYGINSERLLVHARRCALAQDAQTPTPNAYINNRSIPLAAAIAMLLGSALGAYGMRMRKRSRKEPDRCQSRTKQGKA